MTQPEALRLADELEEAAGEYWRFQKSTGYGAAAQLRRLSAVEAQRDALLEALKGLVAWADDLRRDDPVEDLRKARAAIKAVEETK